MDASTGLGDFGDMYNGYSREFVGQPQPADTENLDRNYIQHIETHSNYQHHIHLLVPAGKFQSWPYYRKEEPQMSITIEDGDGLEN